ncbi:hypothetical protein HAX54_044049 [Datura stramonium]|uniref:HD-Zip IV C-terminal domain-containing protein n=1 Tax=Datura stramonium TaxID=4076 RepID=A0ABS8W5G8_DATST|nr:hypothetical protein [Datura stramonium]
MGYGAQRWLATLQRQSEYLGVTKLFVDPTVDSNVKRGIGMLAQRMTRNFCAGVCATTHKWKPIQLANGEDAKLMTRENNSVYGEPVGVVLSATKTIWVPMKHQYLFEFFMNDEMRNQWDVLSNGGPMQHLVNIFKDQNINNRISLYGDDISANPNNILILQDAFTDATGSLLVYATINSLVMNVLMKGEDASCVDLFSNGIAIVPDCFQNFSPANTCSDISKKNDNEFCTGSLVTVGFQMLVNSFPGTNDFVKSIKTANDLISHTIHKIKTAPRCK